MMSEMALVGAEVSELATFTPLASWTEKREDEGVAYERAPATARGARVRRAEVRREGRLIAWRVREIREEGSG